MLGLLLSLWKLPIAMADLLIHDICFETHAFAGPLEFVCGVCVDKHSHFTVMIAKLILPSGQMCTLVRPAVGMLSNFCLASKQVLFLLRR